MPYSIRWYAIGHSCSGVLMFCIKHFGYFTNANRLSQRHENQYNNIAVKEWEDLFWIFDGGCINNIRDIIVIYSIHLHNIFFFQRG